MNWTCFYPGISSIWPIYAGKCCLWLSIKKKVTDIPCVLFRHWRWKMKTKTDPTDIRSLRQVWEWKDAVYEATKNISCLKPYANLSAKRQMCAGNMVSVMPIQKRRPRMWLKTLENIRSETMIGKSNFSNYCPLSVRLTGFPISGAGTAL
jgi:hypothetical protein